MLKLLRTWHRTVATFCLTWTPLENVSMSVCFHSLTHGHKLHTNESVTDEGNITYVASESLTSVLALQIIRHLMLGMWLTLTELQMFQ